MKNLREISYYPELRRYAGSINAVLLVAELEACFKETGKAFYKFMEPCGHEAYRAGGSWTEELQMTATEFRTAFKNIGIVYKSKKAYYQSKDKFQGKMYLSYYDRISKLTYYMRNDELVDRRIREINDEGKEAENEEAINKDINKEERATKEDIVNGKVEASEGIYEAEVVQAGSLSMIEREGQQVDQDHEVTERETINIEGIRGDVISRDQGSLVGIIDHKTNSIKEKSNTDIKTKNNNQSVIDCMTERRDDEIQSGDISETVGGHSAQGARVESIAEVVTRDTSETTEVRGAQMDKQDPDQLAAEAAKSDLATEEDGDTSETENSHGTVPFETIRQLFNQICYSYQPINAWNEWQKQKVAELWARYSSELETFKAVFENLEASDFLSGRVKAWKAQLGWLLNAGHFADVLSGRYMNYQKPEVNHNAVESAAPIDMLCHDWDFDEIERLEQERIDRILQVV